VNGLSTEDIYREIGEIIQGFNLYECAECAVAILEWLDARGIERALLRLRTKYKDEDFIISDRMTNLGMLNSITRNGIHYGISIRGQVFDNLSPTGMKLVDWIKDFHCPSEEFTLDELDGFPKPFEVQ
jgi:Papain fold toxin 2